MQKYAPSNSFFPSSLYPSSTRNSLFQVIFDESESTASSLLSLHSPLSLISFAFFAASLPVSSSISNLSSFKKVTSIFIFKFSE